MGYFVNQSGQIFEGDDASREALESQGFRVASDADIIAHNERMNPAAASPSASVDPTPPVAPEAGPVAAPGYFVQESTGQLFEGKPEDAPNLARQGMRAATSEDVVLHNEGIQHAGFVEGLKVVPETLAGMQAKLGSKLSPFLTSDLAQAGGEYVPRPVLPGTTVEDLKPHAYTPEQLAPFAFTEAARGRRRAREGVVTATTVAADLATGLLIPGSGLAGILASSAASGLLTEAGTSLVTGDEYSMKNAAFFAGVGLAFEGAGALAFKGAMAAKGKVKNYLDGFVDKAQRAAAEEAIGETDAVLQAEKFRRNADALYTQHQTSLDEALSVVDARIAEAPERLFTPSALKKSVSGNEAVQGDEFLGLAVKLDQAAQVAEVPGLTEINKTMQEGLGKSGPGMFDALRRTKRELEALGSDSPLVKEALEAVDESLRNQTTWGRAAKNYADVSDDLVADAVKTPYDVRKLEAREALDERLDRARRNAALTGDKKLASAVKKAEASLAEADKVTGARIMAETGPKEIAEIEKKLAGFEKRGPVLAGEMSDTFGKLKKALDDGASPDITPDSAIDYITARVTGIGGKKDPMRAVIANAEKRIAELKAAGAKPTRIARAESLLNDLRHAVDEVNSIPAAAKRVRDYKAQPTGPGLGAKVMGKITGAGDEVATEEIGNMLQPVLRGGFATVGGHIFGVPGFIGGYLTGRFVDKRFGQAISRYLWKRSKTQLAKQSKAVPGEFAAGAAGAALGGLMTSTHGNVITGAAVGYGVGRAGAQAVKKVAGKLRGKAPGEAAEAAKKAVAKASAKAEKAAAKAAKSAAKEDRAAEKAVGKHLDDARARLDPKAAEDAEKASYDAINKATHEVSTATTPEARAAAQSRLDAALAARRAVESRVGKAARVVKDAVKKHPGQVAGVAALTAGAALGADDQNESGAVAASAGLLLLLLPRGLGFRQAISTLEEKSAQLAANLPAGATSRIRQAMADTREEITELLHRAARESGDQWNPAASPEALISAQANRVHVAYYDRFGETISELGDNNDSVNYVRNELWASNLELMDQSDELMQAYHAEAGSLVRADREAIAASSPNAPDADEIGRRERIAELRAGEVGALRNEAIANNRLLSDDALGAIRATFQSRRLELVDMAMSYVRGEPIAVAGRVLSDPDELLAAQAQVLMNEWQRVGRSLLGADPDVAQRVARTELEHINANAASAMRAFDFNERLLGTPDNIRERLSGIIPARDLDRVSDDISAAWRDTDVTGHQRLELARAAGRVAPSLDLITDAYLTGRILELPSGTPMAVRTRADLVEAQRAVLREEYRRVLRLPNEDQYTPLAPELENVIELQREWRTGYRAQSPGLAEGLANEARTPTARRLAQPDEGQSTSVQRARDAMRTSRLPEASADVSPERMAEFAPETTHRALADSSARVGDELRDLGWSAEERHAMDNAIESARDETRSMLQSYIRGEDHVGADGRRLVILNNRDALDQAQRRAIRERFAAEMGIRVDTTSREADVYIEAELRRINANDAQSLPEAQQVAAGARAARESSLKPSDERAAPAMVDGLPYEAATRLDDALEGDLRRLHDRFDALGGGHAEAMQTEAWPDLEAIARSFARDNPNLVDEDGAVAYARRRWEGIADEDEALRLREEGGFARSQTIGEPDDDTLRQMLEEANLSLADDDIRNYSGEVLSRIERDAPDLTARERARLRELYDEAESDLDDAWSRRRRDLEEPESEPDSAPDSEPDSARSYGRGSDDGLPPDEELAEIGLRHVEMNSRDGIRNVFGQDLDADDLTNLLSLKYIHEYGDEIGRLPETRLEITYRTVNYEARAGDFEMEQTYRRTLDNELKVTMGLLKIPPEKQGTGIMKDMARDLVEPLERLGADEITTSAAWMGKYAWLALGFRPEAYAERAAISEFRSRLVELAGGESPMIAEYMKNITDTRALAHAWLPVDLLKDRMPELRQGWAELTHRMAYSGVQLQPFEEAVMRKSRSGNEQFLAGKFFLLASDGPWNSGLSLKIRPGEAWYEDTKRMLGLGAGVLALGFGAHELMGAFENHTLTVKGIPGGDVTPPEVVAYSERERERSSQIEGTREKLGYLTTESANILRDTARALANPAVREKSVQAVPGVTQSRGVASFLGSNATLEEAYAQKRDVLLKMQKNPMVLVDELTEGLGELQQNAPELHAKMTEQTYKVVQFLNSKLPSTVGASLVRPDGSPPNAMAIRQFALYYSAATDPSSVALDLANNRARKEQVDTLREVWPDVYDDLKMAVAKQLADSRPTVAQRIRLDLHFDFGENLDRGLSPGLVAALDSYRQRQGGPGGKGAPGGNAAPARMPTRRTQGSIGASGALGSLGLGPAAGQAMG